MTLRGKGSFGLADILSTGDLSRVLLTILYVLVAFLVILWRGLRLSWVVTDDFARYVALGVTVAVVVQAMVNMSVVLDLAPTKGLPLPMISQGGSSLASTLTSLGLLLSVSEHAG